MIYNSSTVLPHFLIFLLLVILQWRRQAARGWEIILFTSVFFNRIALPVGGGVDLKLDHLTCLLAILGNLKHLPSALKPLEFRLLAALAAAFALSSIVASSAPLFCLRKLAIPGLYFLGAAVVVGRSAATGGLREQLALFVSCAIGVLAASLAGYALHFAGLDFGLVRVLNQPWLIGPSVIANLFGTSAAVIGLLSLRSLLERPAVRSSDLVGLELALCCVFFSYTRMAWALSLAAGLILGLENLLRDRRWKAGHTWALALTTASIVVFALLTPQIGFQEKFRSTMIVDLGIIRRDAIRDGLAAFQSHPWLGTGFQDYEHRTGVDTTPRAATQMILPLQVLQYGGLLAATLSALFLVAVHAKALSALRRVRRIPGFDSPLLPLLLGFDLLVIAYLVTSGIFSPFFWFITAFLVHAGRERQDPA